MMALQYNAPEILTVWVVSGISLRTKPQMVLNLLFENLKHNIVAARFRDVHTDVRD